MMCYMEGSKWMSTMQEVVREDFVCPDNLSACPDPGSNRGSSDLRSDALPTELSGLMILCTEISNCNRGGATSYAPGAGGTGR